MVSLQLTDGHAGACLVIMEDGSSGRKYSIRVANGGKKAHATLLLPFMANTIAYFSFETGLLWLKNHSNLRYWEATACAVGCNAVFPDKGDACHGVHVQVGAFNFFFKSVDGSESCGIEMEFPMLSYFCFIEFH